MLLATAFIVLVSAAFAFDAMRRGLFTAALSPFWIFSFFFLLSYPVKLMVIEGGFPYLAPAQFSDAELDFALIVAAGFWLMVWCIYFIWQRGQRRNQSIWTGCRVEYEFNTRSDAGKILIALALLCVSLLYYYQLLRQTNFTLINAFTGNEQNEARTGAGPTFLLGQLYFFAVFIYFFLVKSKNTLLTVTIVCAALIIALFETTLLATRRPLFLVLYVLLIYLVLRGSGARRWAVSLALFPYVTAWLAPLGQVIRYQLLEFLKGQARWLNLDSVVVGIGSTFEGIEHLAAYIRTVNLRQMIVGVDAGAAYVYNAGLALIPRTIWPSKPEIYGAVAIQDFLYASGYATITLPSGVAVDAMYGFGLVGLIPYAAILGGALVWMERTLFYGSRVSALSVVMAIYLYINLFNVVRGGTGVLQGVLILAVVVLLSSISDIAGLKWRR